MFDSEDSSEGKEKNITELGMRKSGENLQIWVSLEGHEVFYAEPHVKMCKGPVQAAVQTFLSRVFGQELIEMAKDDSDSRSIF